MFPFLEGPLGSPPERGNNKAPDGEGLGLDDAAASLIDEPELAVSVVLTSTNFQRATLVRCTMGELFSLVENPAFF